jgi:hypothetical protein
MCIGVNPVGIQNGTVNYFLYVTPVCSLSNSTVTYSYLLLNSGARKFNDVTS